MTREEGSENPRRSSSNLQDGVDEVQTKPLIKYRRNPRPLCSNDIEDEVKSSDNSNDDRDDRTISFTSSFVKAAQEKRPEIIPFKKRLSYMICHDDNLSPQSQQPATRESGGKLPPSMSAGEQNIVEKKTGDQNLVEGSNSISTKIHDVGHSETTGITPQGGHDYNHIAPTDDEDDGKQADETKQDTGGAGSGCSPTDTVIEKRDENNETDCHEQVQEMAMKDGVPGDVPVGYFVSLMMDDGQVPDQLIELGDNGGGSSCLLADHAAVESKTGGSGEAGDGGQQASVEDGGHGNNLNNTPGGEEPNEGSENPVESKNDSNIEVNTPGGEEKSGGKKPMESDISVMIHDGGSSKISKMPEGSNEADGVQVHQSTDLVIIPGSGGGGGKGKEIAITPTLEGDDHTPPSGIANTSGSILAQGQQDPNTIIEGEDADDGLGQQASKNIGSSNALDPNGGIDHDEPQVQPPVQQATRTIRLFGVDISCEQEHHVPITIRDGGGNNQETGDIDGPRPMMQPRPAIRLFGVDIFSDRGQLDATGDGDGRSSNTV